MFVFLLITLQVLSLENATNQYVPSGASACKVQYALARISWTNPNLNTNNSNPIGGSYNRVAITEQTTASPPLFAARFVEIGWVKQTGLPAGYPNGDSIAVAYTNSNGTPIGFFVPRPQRSNHLFGIQYDPLIHLKWFIYENAQPIFGPNPSDSFGIVSNFTNGCAAVAGGEVIFGYEDMGNTRFYNLRWGTISSSGIVSASNWASNTQRLYEGRYSCTVSTTTDHSCGP